MTHLHNPKKKTKLNIYHTSFLNHGTCPKQTQTLSRCGYILVNIAQITVDIWQLQDQTVFGKCAEFEVNIRTCAGVVEGEGGVCGGCS